MIEDELRVVTANEVFYDAFAVRDLQRMDDLWSRSQPVTCIHPGHDALVGRDAVMESWRAIFRGDGVRIEPSSVRAFVTGDAAWVVCHEAVAGGPPILVATNVFAREGDAWKMVHHQAGQFVGPSTPEPSGPTN